ncbi:hypothetical protein PHYPSEUDO_006856 [Phytophthora pseudosyringae]|uniref:Uncharacterized protein n=1 Tax=Phytophthora pseudosyringae TaxID=221518 RepID=A0A8T1WAU0_9STRA|nr:hypothetical protein PHYPSEUDO_006856 [Phytophthora pseudosyringae]
MTRDEQKAMEAYVNRRLELPAPPTFVTCTATGFKRAALLSVNQVHIEALLIAGILAKVRLGQNIPRQSILRELVADNATYELGRTRMRPFIKAAQRIVYDGDHTLKIEFLAKRLAAE